MNTNFPELYRNEQYKFGSKAREEAEFADHVARVRAVQERLAREHFSGARHRVFHAKMHACLLGTLTLRPERPATVRRGIFADGGRPRFNVLARFSNGVGTEEHDLKPDVRGLALKIFGVAEESDRSGGRDALRRLADDQLDESVRARSGGIRGVHGGQRGRPRSIFPPISRGIPKSPRC